VTQRWKVVVERPAGVDGTVPLVPFGPFGDRLPARFDVLAEAVDRPLRMRVEATFDGTDRVCARSVRLERIDGRSICPEDMVGTQLATVMHNAVWTEAMKYVRGGGVYQAGRSQTGPPTEKELRTLARMYWFVYVGWGKPRQYVMSAFELPRSTANAWIRKARDKYGLPGLHAEDGG
jgi:hypothetical protein